MILKLTTIIVNFTNKKYSFCFLSIFQFCLFMNLLHSFLVLVLVSLKRNILFSSVALVVIRVTVLPLDLTPQRYMRVWATIGTIGISASCSEENSSLKSFSGDRGESCCLTSDSNQLSTFLVLKYDYMQAKDSVAPCRGNL